MSEPVKLEKVLRVLVDTGSYVCVDPMDELLLRGAVRSFLAGLGDQLINLTLLGGALWTVPASRIGSWVLSTPEERKREAEALDAFYSESPQYNLADAIDLDDQDDLDDGDAWKRGR